MLVRVLVGVNKAGHDEEDERDGRRQRKEQSGPPHFIIASTSILDMTITERG